MTITGCIEGLLNRNQSSSSYENDEPEIVPMTIVSNLHSFWKTILTLLHDESTFCKTKLKNVDGKLTVSCFKYWKCE